MLAGISHKDFWGWGVICYIELKYYLFWFSTVYTKFTLIVYISFLPTFLHTHTHTHTHTHFQASPVSKSMAKCLGTTGGCAHFDNDTILKNWCSKIYMSIVIPVQIMMACPKKCPQPRKCLQK